MRKALNSPERWQFLSALIRIVINMPKALQMAATRGRFAPVLAVGRQIQT